jgi:membrane dipeptidase
MARSLVVDTHAHDARFVPQPFRGLYRMANRRTMPPELPFDVLAPSGVDVVVANAVGDPVVTRLFPGSPWRAVVTQIHQMVLDIRSVGGDVVLGAGSLLEGRPGLIVGLEGADVIGEDVGQLGRLHELGVRAIVPVHLGDNQLGTTTLPWQQYVGPIPARRSRQKGLTPLGAAAIERMNDLGILIDISHADRQTALDIITASRHPVVASHSGARACHDFARYLTDEEARAVARTGGLIGLWPYWHRGHGMADLHAWTGHARHLADLVGPEHLCIGTDMNGVPGLMAGYRGETDFNVLLDGLRKAGLGDADIAGIAGANFVRVFRAVCP